MDALFWLLTGVMAIELAVAGTLVTINCVRHARTGRPLDFLRPRLAVVEVDQPPAAAHDLCREGLRAVLHMTDGQRVRFSLHQLGAARTRIAVTGEPRRFRALTYAFTRRRVTLMDRYAAWLAEHGGGRIVEKRFGNAS